MAPPKKPRITLPCHTCNRSFEASPRSLSTQAYRESKIVFCGQPCYQDYKIKQASNNEDVFWSRISKEPGQGPNGDCHEWQGTIGTLGYGEISWVAYRRAQGKMKGKIILAHRTAYELAVGPIPEGLGLLHSCDNPPCCNPDHLAPGTQRANIQDAWEKGRMRTGEDTYNAKRTTEEIKEIKLHILLGYSLAHLASKFGVNNRLVSQLKNGDKWRHVEVTEKDLAARSDLLIQFDLDFCEENRAIFNYEKKRELGPKPRKRKR